MSPATVGRYCRDVTHRTAAPAEYRFETLDPTVASPARDAWVRAVALGFLEADLTDEQVAKQGEWLARDAGRLRAAYHAERQSGLGEPDQPVATFRSWNGTVNTGGGHLEPANFITDVTVRQTERRRGLLRRLMVDDLREARDRGLSLASLTVTEATIYSRFGFGISSLVQLVELDISHGFSLVQEPVGRVVQLDPSSDRASQLWTRVFDQFQRQTFGSHDESSHHLDTVLGRFDWDSGKPDTRLRAVCHLDEEGNPDGVMSYTIKRDEGLTIVDMVVLNDAAELAFWAFIGHHDLLKKATWRRFNPDSALRWAITDPRRLKVTDVRDGMWTRVLDVPAAVRARRFERDDELTIAVHDPSGIAEGTFWLRSRGGIGECEPTDAAPDLEMGIETFSSLYLGGVPARVLFQARRITGSAPAAGRLDDLFRVPIPPRSVRYF